MSQFTEMAEEWARINLKPPVAGVSANAAPRDSFTCGPDRGPGHDPFAWAEDFHKWALSKCVFRDRCFGGIWALHRDFCEWTISRESVPCRRMTFERLLADQGFLLADGFVSGLILREDLCDLPCLDPYC